MLISTYSLLSSVLSDNRKNRRTNQIRKLVSGSGVNPPIAQLVCNIHLVRSAEE